MKKLLSSYPNLVKEWHPTKNGGLTPEDYTHGSKRKVWWLCPKSHTYKSVIYSRTGKNQTGCPYCAGKKASEENNLLLLYPDVAKEWHPTKNIDFAPDQVTPRSDKKAWWLCPKGHSYEAIIKNRTRDRGCPHCSHQQSEPEIRILAELKWIFEEIKHRYKVDGAEVDIFIPSLNLGIEYDGKYWHHDKELKDLDKNKHLLCRGVRLVRVRQHPLEPLTENDLIVKTSLKKGDLDDIVKKIAPFVDNNAKEKIIAYLAKSSFTNEELFKQYRSYFPSPFPENSLLETHPELSDEWDYDKNHPLKPENFSYGSRQIIWWKCPAGHKYQTIIKNRTTNNKTGCPLCSGRVASEDNNLQNVFPEVAKEWHPTKNVDLTPKDVTYGSGTKVWWLCPKKHSYNAAVHSRTGQKSGCPYCSGKKAIKNNKQMELPFRGVPRT